MLFYELISISSTKSANLAALEHPKIETRREPQPRRHSHLFPDRRLRPGDPE